MAQPAAQALDEDISLQRAPSGHMLLPVTINGDGPYDFILDTGASRSAVASAVAEQYGFQSDWTDFDDVQALTTRFEAEFFELPIWNSPAVRPPACTAWSFRWKRGTPSRSPGF